MIRDKKELELFESETNFVINNQISKADFIKFMESLLEKNKLPSYLGCIKHIKIFVDVNYRIKILQFDMIDRRFCLNFKKYLLSKISQNTARLYIKILRTGLNNAIEEGYIK